MTQRSEALLATDRPERYGKQLAAHLGRRNGSDWSELDRSGWIQFNSGRAELSCAAGRLRLVVEGEADSLAQLEDVVGRHLVRFGDRDDLQVRWTRDNGEPGTEQRVGGD